MALPRFGLLLIGLGNGINPRRASGNGKQSLKQQQLSYPADAGYPVRRGLSGRSLLALEYRIIRFRDDDMRV
jgi:hypothetical protein